ncbi:MAG TPA: M20/M25/M40 family metallo-hydrolase [Agriterribacter sp.]|nr:M20/M25/M40 family metallo-hydrolase [Agriterribacter sp.]
MNKIYLSVIILLSGFGISAQDINSIITVKKVKKIEKTLSSDKMMGRGLFTPGLDRAAAFISEEFKKAGLAPSAATGFSQEFTLIAAEQTDAKGLVDGKAIDGKRITAFSTKETLSVTQQSGYENVSIEAGDKFLNKAYGYVVAGKNYLVWVDTAHQKNFAELSRLKRETFKSDNSVLFVLANATPSQYSFTIEQQITEKPLKNIVGILPGKTRKDEYVIFSGHYDHLGTHQPNADGDSIFNGANDDAAGITAVIMLAKYFVKLKNNERTIIFTAFTAEETGGFGSQYFSRQFNPDQVMAMFNIEMIGTDSKWGTNSAYITGYEKTDMGKILEKNLEGSPFKFYPDPYPDQQLFYRSDNATLAKLGVPAHTISTSKMDSETYYHTLDDEFETLDIKNMTEIIKAIATSSTSIIKGTDTPTRVDSKQLR